MKTKTVGREPVSTKQSFLGGLALQMTTASLFPLRLAARGVFRFRTFGEADQWLMQETVKAARASRREKMSFVSRKA